MSHNIATKTISIDNVTHAKTIYQKIVGLLHTKNPQSMYLQTRFGIHSFGMRYTIDVIILSNDFEVKVMKPNFKPNNVFLWNPLWQHVLELPDGTIEKKNIRRGDIISIRKI